MLGRLARMLRVLGYDTLYSPAITTAQLQEIARREERVLLTRGHTEKRFPGLQNVVSLDCEQPSEQLREVVERLGLDPHGGLWTRCTLCNGEIAQVEKESVRSDVQAKVFQLYGEFFRCAGCGHVYCRGSHVERILKNLESLLGSSGD
jgi:uncharacterized protein with PIN domain